MIAIHVHVHVKPEYIDAFIEATLENAKQSLKEPGVARFDIIQEMDNAGRFVLMEVYRTPEDPARHKETSHYHLWREKVADMMAGPRSGIKYTTVFPGDAGW